VQDTMVVMIAFLTRFDVADLDTWLGVHFNAAN
jgi:hypothetical protein